MRKLVMRLDVIDFITIIKIIIKKENTAMKSFKKVMAGMLMGIMVIGMLTGCGGDRLQMILKSS